MLQRVEPIYVFCDDLFTYIGATLSDSFWGADSLNKLRSYLQNLSELVPRPGAGLNPFSLNGQSSFCFSEILAYATCA